MLTPNTPLHDPKHPRLPDNYVLPPLRYDLAALKDSIHAMIDEFNCNHPEFTCQTTTAIKPTPQPSHNESTDGILRQLTMLMTMTTLKKAETTETPMPRTPPKPIATAPTLCNVPHLTQFAADIADDVKDKFPMMMLTMKPTTPMMTKKNRNN